MRNLQRNLAQGVGLHTLVVCHFVVQVLRLCEHEARKHSEGLWSEVGRDLVRLQLHDVLLQVFEDPGGLLHVLAGVLDLATLGVQVHVDGGTSETHANIELGAQSIEKRGV